MTVNEAIRTAIARAPVVTCGVAIWKIGNLRFPRIKSITHDVSEKGKLNIYASCVDGNTSNCLVVVGLDDIELAPDCSETLRRIIYKENKNA